MRTLSDKTLALLDRLDARNDLWQRLFGKYDDGSNKLEQIAGAGEPAAIPHIIPLIFVGRPELATAAAKAVQSLVEIVSPAELLWLDELMRRFPPVSLCHYPGDIAWKWEELLPEKIDYLLSFGSSSLSIIGLASFHRSGYVREAAVKKLAGFTNGTELSFLLIRLYDWVVNVREAAREALERRLIPEYAPEMVGNLALISRLQMRRDPAARDRSSLIDSIFELLKSSECHSALLAGLKSRDRVVRRSCFHLAAESAGVWSKVVAAGSPPNPPLQKGGLPEAPLFKGGLGGSATGRVYKRSTGFDHTQSAGIEKLWLLDRAIADGDIAVRLWGARKIRAELEGDMLNSFLLKMSGNKFMPVRREALQAYVEKFPAQAPSQLYSNLCDRHSSIRELARYYLNEIAPMDFAAFYRQALTSNEIGKLCGAILGLGDVGGAIDADVVVPFCSHPNAKVRCAALRSAAKLNGDVLLDIFVEALTDDRPSISRAGREALLSRARLVGVEGLGNIFRQDPRFHVRKNALFLLAKLGKWDSLAFLIWASGSGDEAIAHLGEDYLQRWLWRYNSQFSTPDRAQMAEIKRAIAACDRAMSANLKKELLFAIAPFA